MLKSFRRIVWCLAGSAVLSLVVPASAVAGGHGSHRGGAANRGAHVIPSRRGGSHPERRQRSPSGPLSYDAYWRAATSPAPPRPNQDYNRYWQKMQAWQEYHNRLR